MQSFQLGRAVPLFAAVMLAGVACWPATAVAQSTVRIETITPTHFSVLDGALQGEVKGFVNGTEPVNLFGFPGINHEKGWRVSPFRIGAGARDFGFPLRVELNALVPNGVATFFASPSDDGRYRPGPRVVYQKRVVLPPPEITSATGSRRAVTLHGKALPGARVALAVADKTFTTMASGSGGGWSHTFSDVAAGSHVARARVVDLRGTFPDSVEVTRSVEAEADIIRPLAVTAPAPGGRVDRIMNVQGVASPERGTVRVQVGDGPVVEATVNRGDHRWGVNVASPVPGTVPLVVSLPSTGEVIRQNVQVAPFGNLVVDRLVSYIDIPGKANRLIAKGFVSLDADDFDIRYYNRGRDWTTLAIADDEGRWGHEGAYPADLFLDVAWIDGTFHARAATISVPSLGNRPMDGIKVPVLYAGPELTSPLRVQSTTTLEGYDPSPQFKVPVEITLPDGRRLTAMSGADGRWSMPVEGLPPGRLVISLGKTLAQTGQYVETTRYTLEVVGTP